jgi:hypothetical protein
MGKIYIFLLFFIFGTYSSSNAQIVVSTSHTATDVFTGGISFNVSNKSLSPIRITEISSIHTANNPAINPVVKVWYRVAPINAAISSVSTLTGWILAKTQVKTGMSTSVQPFATNLSIDIPAGDTIAIFLETNQQSAAQFVAPPNVGLHTFDSVTIQTGFLKGYTGLASSPSSHPRGFVGNIKFTKLTPCVGSPNPGNIVSDFGFCAGVNKTYFLNGASFASSIAYQWQTGPTATGPWTNVGTNSLSFTGTFASNTFIRVNVTCNNSGQTSSSPLFFDTLKPPAYCMCTPAYVVDDIEEEILKVKINNVERLTNCSSIPLNAGPSSVLGKYTDWRPYGSMAVLNQGSFNELTIDYNTCGVLNRARGYTVYIDYNANRIFESTEVISSGTILANTSFGERLVTFIVPSNAGGALTVSNPNVEVLMRVIYYSSTTPMPFSGCPTASFVAGEIEDHVVTIQLSNNCTGKPAPGIIDGTRGFCIGTNSVFTNYNATIAKNMSRTWQIAPTATGPWTTLVGQTGEQASSILPGTTYVRAIVNCLTSGLSDTTPVFIDTLNPSYKCVCPPPYYSVPITNLSDYIENVSMFGNYNTSIVHTNTGMALNPLRFQNYRDSFDPIRVIPGGTFTGNISLNSANTTNNNVRFYVDYNNNGIDNLDILTPVLSNVSITPASPTNFTFSIPASTPIGLYPLRVRYLKSTTNIAPCVNAGIIPGEIHDYVLEVYLPPFDLVLQNIDSPKSGCSLAQVPVTFRLKNSGLNGVIPNMSYSIDGGAPVNQLFPILQKDSTRTYAFTQKIDFSSITGKKTIKVWSNLPSDALKSNDTLEIEMENYLTPPKPSVLSDTVCQNELTSTLEAISVPGFTTNWFSDAAGINKIDQGNFKLFTPPFTNSTFYVNSSYEKFDSEGLPAVVNATAETTTTKGLNFTVLRPRVRIHSVKVEFTVPGLSRVEVRTAAGVLIKTVNYTVVNPGLNQVDLNVDLNAGTYRIMLTLNPGASLTTVVNANPFNPIIPSNGSILITSAVGTTTQYPYFYDWVVSYAYCTSTMDSVKLVRVLGQNSPSLDLRDSSLCSYPAFFLDGQNPGMRYKWSTNDTTQIIEIKNSGQYKLTVTNSFGCNVRDSSYITIRQSPIFSLGRDSTICSNKSMRLYSGYTNKGYNHTWFPSQKLNPYLDVNTPGQIICEVFNTNTNCGYKDTIMINSAAAPTVFLGNDTFTCKNNPIILQAPFNANYIYKWHDLSINATKLISSTVMAKVTVTDTSTKYKCNNSDSIFVRISNFLKPSLGADIVHCGQEKSISYPDAGGFNYKWSNGYVGNITYINKDGDYVMTVTENGTTCSESDTINVKLANSPKLSLGEDIITCNSSVTLKANAGFNSYSWSGGGATDTKVVTSNGSYTVTASNSCETVTDNINVTFVVAPTNVTLPADTIICSPLVLSIPNQLAPNQILWSTNSTSNTITVDSTATYWVSVSNLCGTISDAIYVFKELAPVANFDILKTGMYGVFTNKSQQAKSVSWDFGDNTTSTLYSPSHLYLQKGRYNVTLTITNNCGDQAVYSDSIIIDGNSSIINIEKNNLKLYPIPVLNSLNIEINDISNGTYSVYIHDIYGRKILNEEIQVTNSKMYSIINMSNFTNGMYWLSIESNSKNIIKNEKIIINK